MTDNEQPKQTPGQSDPLPERSGLNQAAAIGKYFEWLSSEKALSLHQSAPLLDEMSIEYYAAAMKGFFAGFAAGQSHEQRAQRRASEASGSGNAQAEAPPRQETTDETEK